MAFLNKVFLMGNLTRDVELRYTPSGVPVAKMGLAVNSYFKTSDGDTKEETLFINVVAWRKLAENCAEYLSKGRPIFVEGRLKMDQYEWEGQKRKDFEVVARNVQFLGGGRREGAGTEDDYTPDKEEDVPSEDDIPF